MCNLMIFFILSTTFQMRILENKRSEIGLPDFRITVNIKNIEITRTKNILENMQKVTMQK